MSSGIPDSKQSERERQRAERLRAALRANLQRRKAQSRARKGADLDAEPIDQIQDKGEEWTESS